VTAESGSETCGVLARTGGPGSGAAAGRNATPAAKGGGGREVDGATSDGIGVNGDDGAGRSDSTAGGDASIDHPFVVFESTSSIGTAPVCMVAGFTGMIATGFVSGAGIAGFVGAYDASANSFTRSGVPQSGHREPSSACNSIPHFGQREAASTRGLYGAYRRIASSSPRSSSTRVLSDSAQTRVRSVRTRGACPSRGASANRASSLPFASV
jgi:hypothetical protein